MLNCSITNSDLQFDVKLTYDRHATASVAWEGMV